MIFRYIPLRQVALALACGAAVAGCSGEEGAAPPLPPAAEAPTEAPAPEQEATLALYAAEATPDQLQVDLRFRREAGVEGPRAVEIFLQLSENLTLEGFEPLDAAQAAGKTLVVQEPRPGEVRVILYATSNLAPLESGGLARLRLARRDASASRVDFIAERVNLAPAAAAQGLRLAEPLVLGGR